MYLLILRVHFKKKKKKDQQWTQQIMLLQIFCAFCFSDFLYKSLCYWYSFALHVNAIQMGTHNISLYKVDKTYTGCYLKITE